MSDINKHLNNIHGAGAKTIKTVGRAVPYAGRAAASISRSTGISQDNIIFGMLLLAFMVYITVKGELPTYLGFFIPQGHLGPKTDTVTTGQTATPANPVVGTVIGAGHGQPGVNLNNPVAGIPWVGGWFQTLLPGNSNGSATQQVPGQANPIPWGSVGNWFKNLFQ